MLMQELDQSILQQRKLVTMAQKLDSEVALLEQSGGAGSVPPVTTDGTSAAPTKSPRAGRKRRGGKRDQQNSAKVAAVAGSSVKDVVISTPDQRPCAPSNLPVHSVPLLNPAGFTPQFGVAQPGHAVAGFRAGLVMAPASSVGSTRMTTIRFVNGGDSPARFQKQVAPGMMGAMGLQLPRGRQDSSSSTDSAETVRHLEHGTCVGSVDRYLAASAVIQSSAGSGPGERTCGGAFTAPPMVSSTQNMRLYFRPALLSGVSFPASRSELEQYKQVVHGSAHIPPTEPSTMSTPKSQVPHVRQRSPGRGRGRKTATSGDPNASRNVVVPVVATSSMPRFFSVGLVPSAPSMQAVQGGIAQPSISATHGMFYVCTYLSFETYLQNELAL